MEKRKADAVDYSKTERLVVFDFDNTIYAQKLFGSNISCYLKECPMLELSDAGWLRKVIKRLHEAGIQMGVASFGSKDIIIKCMNGLLYGVNDIPEEGAYFNRHNVITVVDVKEHWKQTLNRSVSRTFKHYKELYQNDLDRAFEEFLAKEQPEKHAKFWCLKLPPSAKLEMIEMIRNFYNQEEEVPIELNEIRFFDDDKGNVESARAGGVMAHLVPHPGLSERWWQEECERIDACGPYFPDKHKKLKAEEIKLSDSGDEFPL